MTPRGERFAACGCCTSRSTAVASVRPRSPSGRAASHGGGSDKYFVELRGTVIGQKPKDKVTVWFTATGGKASV